MRRMRIESLILHCKTKYENAYNGDKGEKDGMKKNTLYTIIGF